MSHVVLEDGGEEVQILLKDVIDELKGEIIGDRLWNEYKSWPMYSKFFDNMGPIPHHMHQNAEQAKLVGQEDYVYVWTLGADGIGDEQDKLVTIDVNPDSRDYGQIIDTLSVGGRNEAHHSGLTDDRRYLWAGGLDTSKIFIFG